MASGHAIAGRAGELAVIDEDVRHRLRVGSIVILELVRVVSRRYLLGVNTSEGINKSINLPQKIDTVDVRRIPIPPFPYYSFPYR